MKLVYLFLLLGFVFVSCKENQNSENTAYIMLSSNNASSVFLTKNEKGIPIAYWVETDEKEKKSMVSFSELNDDGSPVSEPNNIPATLGCSDGHGEGAPKMVIKPNGTMVIVFAVKKPTEKNRFAGVLKYSQSNDHGKTWTDAKNIHSSDNPEGSFAYPDLAVLPNGEVAAIWLDSRNRLPYSELYFAKTNGDSGFGSDKKIGAGSCQCCRTELYVSGDGITHCVYRGILPDSSRDMVYIRSADNGNSFSEPVCISSDQWKIDGCPHTGPTMTMSNNQLFFTWFTQGTGSGLFTTSTNDGVNFTSRKAVTDNALVSHPQMISLSDGKRVTVWEEFSVINEQTVKNIIAKVETTDHEFLIPITNSNKRSEFATVLEIDPRHILIAWKIEEQESSKVVIQKITIEDSKSNG